MATIRGAPGRLGPDTSPPTPDGPIARTVSSARLCRRPPMDPVATCLRPTTASAPTAPQPTGGAPKLVDIECPLVALT